MVSNDLSKNKIEIVNQPNKIYEGFNNYMLSSDLKVFGKGLARMQFMEQIKNVPGDIVECGVFKGTGIYNFLKLKRYYFPNSHRKVIGFDFFNTEELLKSLPSGEKEAMETLFKSRGFSHTLNYKNYLKEQINKDGFQDHEFELIEGDVTLTTASYSALNPGLKISLLYLDLDLEKPTYDTLNNLWDNVSDGGMVVFDEYAYGIWSESKGVDTFIKEKGLKLESLNFMCPTAYIKKIYPAI